MTDYSTKVTLALRVTGDLTATLTFTHPALDAEAAVLAGRADRVAVDAWLAGYGEKDREAKT